MPIDVNVLSNKFDGGVSHYDGESLEAAYRQRRVQAEAFFDGSGIDATASDLSVTVTIKNTGTSAVNVCSFPVTSPLRMSLLR